MRLDYTHIVVVLDSSGSMSSIFNDTVGGFNSFLKAQKEAEGIATMSMYQFFQGSLYTLKLSIDGIPVGLKYDFLNIKEVPEIGTGNYMPSGGTPLLDTIGQAIKSTGDQLAAMPGSVRPAKVLFVIITDGEENTSRHYNKAQIKQMITEQTDVYKWEFMYLGANQDAIAVGGHMGISSAKSMSYGTTQDAMMDTYATLGNKTASFRSVLASAAVLDFTPEERLKSQDKVSP